MTRCFLFENTGDKKKMINRGIKHGEQYSTDRHYKVGDVLRSVSSNTQWDDVEKKGLAVVIKSDGPFFRVFWLGNESTSKHDARWGGFMLQDLAPMPDIVDHAATIIQREYV